MELLRLAALDGEDLAVISAHMQDSILRVGDLVYLPKERRFALVARRFDWSAEADAPPKRLLCGLCFERVNRVRTRGLCRDHPDEPLNLLAITFEESDPPSGIATLLFAGGCAIQLEVECVEAQMKDLGPIWAAEGRPHTVADVEPA